MARTRSAAIALLFVLCACRPTPPGSGPGLVPFEQDGRWGYQDAGGRTVIPARYLAAEPFTPQGLAAAADDQGWSYLNRRGQVVVRPFVFDNGPDPFREGLARFVSEGKFGFFDETGRVVVPARYDFAYPFAGGRAKVGMGCRFVPDGEHQRVQGGTWSEIDPHGRPVLREPSE